MANVGKEIIQLYDAYGPVQVFDNGNHRTLMFGSNDQQGCVVKAAPHHIQYDYVRAMLLVLLFRPESKRCLLLGLGSGSLATTLLHHYENLQVEAVELRHAVIQLAHSHFYLPKSPRLTIHQQDAGIFIGDGEPVFDLIFSDIYLATGMDLQQATVKFIDDCQQCLAQDGWLILNFWQVHRRLDLIPLLNARFAQVWTNSIGNDNWVILASNQAQQLTKAETKIRLKALNKRFGFSFSRVARGLKQSLV